MKMKKFIPRLILIITLILIVIGIFITIENPHRSESLTLNDRLISIGYNQKDIDNLKDESLKEILLKYEYNEKYIEIIKNENFQNDKLEEYLNFYNTYNLDIENTIFIINNNYNTTNYDDTTLSLMHQNYYIHNRLERYLAYLNGKEVNDENILNTIIEVNSNLDYEFYTVDNSTDLSKNYLILVNKYYKLDETYVPENLVDIASAYGTGKLESKTYEAFINMYNDALNDGMSLYIRSPYRSYNTQYNLYHSYGKKDGYALADTYSARPGYSEHQTGLAFDLTTRDTTLGTFENTKEFKWMLENAYKYGFILRYPEGKEYITGYIYEPWHYRYVGIEDATKIHELGITFEEYYAYYVEK